MTIFFLIYILLIFTWILVSNDKNEPWDSNTSSWFALSLSIVAGLVGGNTFVTFTGFSYKYGSVTLVYFIGVLLGLLLFHILNPAIIGMNSKYIGSGLVYENYPSSTQLIFLSSNLVRFLAVSLIQIIAGSILMSQISDISYLMSTFLMVITILLYTYKHAFSGVIKTDIIQMICVIVPLLFIAIYYFVVGVNKDIQIVDSQIIYDDFSISKAILFCLFGFLLVIGSLDIWQRYALIKSGKDSLRILILSCIIILISSLGIFSISEIVHLSFSDTIIPDVAFVKFFDTELLPRYFRFPMLIAIISAILSTADTFIYGSAILSVRIINGIRKKEDKSKKLYNKALFFWCIILLVISNLYSDILSIAIFLGNMVFAFSPFLLLLLFGFKPNYKIVNIGLLLCSVFALAVGVIPNIDLEYSYITILLSTIFMCFGMYFRRK